MNLNAMSITNVEKPLSEDGLRAVGRIRANWQKLHDLLHVTGREIFHEIVRDSEELQVSLDSALVMGKAIEIKGGKLVRPVAPEDCRPVSPHDYKSAGIRIYHSFKD